MLDPVLRPFVDAKDEAEAERELERLIQQHAQPLAHAIVGRRLRSFRTGAGRPGPRDQDDVVGDAIVTLIERLHAARNAEEVSPIENFHSYAAAVVRSACAHYIRCHYPARARLKNRLRYVFSTEPQLALWTDVHDELICGLADWRGGAADIGAEQKLSGALDAAAYPWTTMDRAAMTAALVSVLRGVGGPAEFESVVRAVAAAAHIVEPIETREAAEPGTHDPPYEVLIDQRRFLARVWDEVVALPVRQRMALLLNLRDATGAGLLWLLPIAGVATLRQIARTLEVSEPDFAQLWRAIPLDDSAIAERLGCTRQQVINLRMAARKRLTNRLGRTPPLTADGAPRANLTAVSTSLKGSA